LAQLKGFLGPLPDGRGSGIYSKLAM
jgi:hypothetical protein